MCSLEVPDIAANVAPDYADTDLAILFINSGDAYESVLEFAQEGQIHLPMLLDPAKEWEYIYNFGNDGAFGPYPKHVVLNRDHQISWMSRRYDITSLKAALDAALE